MGKITEFQLRDVRCFDGEQSARLGRITLLVGENNTGKSTFLGCYKVFAKLANLHDLGKENHFDDPPFRMGSFGTVVRAGKTDFTIGGIFENHCHTDAAFTFVAGDRDKPVEQEVRFGFNDKQGGNCEIGIIHKSPKRDILTFEGPNFHFDLDISEISYIPISTWLSRYVRYGHLPFRGEPADFRARNDISEKDEIEFAKFIGFFRSSFDFPNPPPFAVNALDPHFPDRERVYSALPPYLEELESGSRSEFARIGSRMKLWNDIATETTPDGSQILVDVAGGLRNLADVGYGVHGLLPLVNAILGSDAVLLLQQPEIHVHPTAQAHLAQFMAENDRDFIIETHSDHLVDRFRICVMDGTLQPEDLSIVYFEPNTDGTKCRIHNISVDSEANLLGVPRSYRSFFLKETELLLGLKR